jgi:hypothetical protein
VWDFLPRKPIPKSIIKYQSEVNRATNPCQIAKHSVMAGLKCPPLTGAHVMMAKAIPMANANPTWRRLPKNMTGRAPSALTVKEATAAIPGNT